MVIQLPLLNIVKPIDYGRVRVRERLAVGGVISLGAGVQSTTLAEMVVTGELPPVDAVIFADTGDEPPWVYAQVDYLSGRLASVEIPLIKVAKPGRGLIHDAQMAEGRFASMPLFTVDEAGKVSMLRRQCTNEYKIQPVKGAVLDWLVVHGYAKLCLHKDGKTSRRVNPRYSVDMIFGISLDEWQRSGDRGPAWQTSKYPLIDKRMTRDDCVAWLEDHNLPVPFKSSCVRCPFHDNTYWRWLKDDYPDLFKLACVFDSWLRSPDGRKRLRLRDDCYLHRSAKPLDDVDFDQTTPLEALLCGDHCHV